MPNVQRKTPDDGQVRCPKHAEFYDNKIGIISVSGWLFKKKSITMHGTMNVKFNNTIARRDLHLQAQGSNYLKMTSKSIILILH